MIEGWLDDQDSRTVAHIMAALEVLGERGPSLGRPLVDVVKGSRFKNMKELRPASPPGSEIRILFAFDPLRSAIMLLAGDKSKGGSGGAWSSWYKRAIPEAEKRYEKHLGELEKQP
ncbi:type II toxin-antitoxin system RelE/ParE family toxin [Adlercreutzia sp. ZJ473]|uniref:type II toxin-antitoxin system RelE/ParE family toxin n=1 Tax=Adlercreutzia sp. ZJ473 TaxID=2722822 RepID=UPI0020A6C1D8|nr:type II toxin-antitoxin system RelE/ParE family toxin [Adlercreutzia sp. ZJ473]